MTLQPAPLPYSETGDTPTGSGRTGRDGATVTTREAAIRLGVSVRTIQLWVEEGRLEAWKTPGGHRRVYASSVEHLIGERAPSGPVAATVREALGVVVVEDNPVALRMLAVGIARLPFSVRLALAANGFEGLLLAGRERPDVVITDLQMPEMNGLEFVRHMKSEHPLIPVILMTGQGSEDIAVEALERGAASYVPKRLLASDLIETVERVLTLAGEKRVRRSLISRMHSLRTQFVLENDPAMLTSMVSYFQGLIVDMGIFTESERLKIGVALEEALLNAAYHGNLEVSSKLREEDHAQFYNLAKERRTLDPYQSRRIFVDVDLSSQGVQYVIRDEGPGFDPHSQPDPRDPANLERPCGRGLLLMRTFMDVVEYNPTGNQVTLIKRSSSRTAPSLAD